jgi:hypothetical protein
VPEKNIAGECGGDEPARDVCLNGGISWRRTGAAFGERDDGGVGEQERGQRDIGRKPLDKYNSLGQIFGFCKI